jgi:hypothetical protein
LRPLSGATDAMKRQPAARNPLMLLRKALHFSDPYQYGTRDPDSAKQAA